MSESKKLNEGTIKKGGLNNKPLSPRPPAPPAQTSSNTKNK
ncbi:TPA: hypothetical protein ACTZ2G_003272 [Bacillus cereus]|uniref:Uncharacterized protein n=1 Tax=Bacillus cereus TaxID=1396 RepID=A0AAW7NA39_BACCE|nr:MULTISPECIES: hypothetical protein [Bacillus cereus group]KYQ00474.1 hypothetical protein B4079_4392 [Bacillus cereus]MDN4871818.1 hypothetical protein [Bacillus cereus]MED1635547.1 hypothetical protein [Bacillus thuringiensis]